ncbi:MAG: hypothetical protein GWM92_07165 [Gemmatimonadetes bacterium]|nr:thioredoxin family protein [Gemmatimonadota bacterium]NIR76859.1 thioredoxin family protein [Gemmatimonadota bacterium]NIT87012.1 thioredoxin family protein [Gemmatimonadota bacterium]NIU29199.1 thioredoxin family protein [Gemmatimonadota bacterium]NIU34296.1 hypothetical protein [Gemmatimonadota bacterium]
MNLEEHYRSAPTFREYLEERVEKHRELWHGLYERASVPDEIVGAARAIPGRWHLLALSEDWCGDAVNTLPYVARLAEEVPGWELRVLERDRNPELMDAHLTDGSRSIPVVMVLDEEFEEIGWWGPRPPELQEWVLGDGQALDKDERYRRQRRWYARDRGETTLRGLLDLFAVAV